MTVRFDADLTRALVTEVHDAYRTCVEDLLLTAAVRAVVGWTGQPSVRIEIEGHGREDDLDAVDVSRTVGWFTCSYPVALTVPEDADPGASIKRIKDSLRGVPGRGLGYGILRYLGEPAAAPSAAAPSILFNYLGRIAPRREGGLFVRVSGVEDSSRDPRNERTHQLEIVALVCDHQLVVDWVYSDTRHERETIEGVAKRFRDELAALIDHCRSSAAGGFTPSDFPDADLDQESLDEFLESLGDD